MTNDAIQFAAWQAMRRAILRNRPFSPYNAVIRRFLP